MAILGVDIPFLDQAYRPRQPDNSGTTSFFEGWQRAQESKRLAMQQQEQDVMLPLRAKAMELQFKNAALDLTAKTHQAEYAISAKAGEAELAHALGKTNWENPIDRANLYSIAAKNPSVMDTKSWAEVQKNIENSDKAAAGRAEAVASSRLFGTTTPNVGATTANPLESASMGEVAITPESLASALQTPGLEGKGIENILTTAARWQMYHSRTAQDKTPNVIEAGGAKFLINPYTGSAHEIKGPADQTALGIRATHDFQTAHNNWMGSLLKLRQQIADMGNPSSASGKGTLKELKTLLEQHQKQEPKLEDYTNFLRKNEGTTTEAAPTATRVRLSDANGKVYSLPSDQVDSFLASPQGKGFKKLE